MPPVAAPRHAAAGRIVAPSGNFAALPPGVRGFFKALLAAKPCRLGFETFQEEMAGSPEASAYFAWVAAANGRLFSSQVRNKRDAPQNAA
jgi:hypothetical protein